MTMLPVPPEPECPVCGAFMQFASATRSLEGWEFDWRCECGYTMTERRSKGN